MLIMAGLVYPVTLTSANGIPLGAEINPKFQRMFLFDTGLFQQALKLDISQIFVTNDFKTINRGALAEIFVGLELVKKSSCYNRFPLYYWQRDSAVLSSSDRKQRFGQAVRNLKEKCKKRLIEKNVYICRVNLKEKFYEY